MNRRRLSIGHNQTADEREREMTRRRASGSLVSRLAGWAGPGTRAPFCCLIFQFFNFSIPTNEFRPPACRCDASAIGRTRRTTNELQVASGQIWARLSPVRRVCIPLENLTVPIDHTRLAGQLAMRMILIAPPDTQNSLGQQSQPEEERRPICGSKPI